MKRQRFIDCGGGSSGSSLGFLQAFVLPIMAMARFVLKNGMLPLHEGLRPAHKRATRWVGSSPVDTCDRGSFFCGSGSTHRAAALQRRRHHWNGRQPPIEASQASCLDLRAAPKSGLCGGDCGGERLGAASSCRSLQLYNTRLTHTRSHPTEQTPAA